MKYRCYFEFGGGINQQCGLCFVDVDVDANMYSGIDEVGIFFMKGFAITGNQNRVDERVECEYAGKSMEAKYWIFPAKIKYIEKIND